jgi:aspartyl-tRNA(Asn)/glutamyl-tRNA(Gln) amidotransferase subunit B
MSLPNGWEMVIGLEVHTELLTKTKLFCGCANDFGAEPNTNVCPICLGLPGSLPVINREAVELAMRIGLALNCRIQDSTFHRKNYFYPDMPKDYQISQYDVPINTDGYLDLPDGYRVRVERAHMEEDTGKTTHLGTSGRIHGAERSLVDYNRSGVPLVEIVSGPDMRTSAQARAYVAELRAILVAVGASDGRMEEGSMRVDANVSVRKSDEPFGTRCEIKNVNSLRSLVRAIEYEALRQIDVLEDGGTIRQETRHWDEDRGETSTLRTKEQAEDYRYFLEPDLVPLAPSAEWRDHVAAHLPTLPAALRRELSDLVGEVTDAQVDTIATVVDLSLHDYVRAAVAAGVPVTLALSRAANEVASQIDQRPQLSTEAFIDTIRRENIGEISATQSKDVLLTILATGASPAQVIADKGYVQMASDDLAGIIDGIIAANPDDWARFVEGDPKVAQFFIGQVMKATKGQANGKTVTEFLNAKRG